MLGMVLCVAMLHLAIGYMLAVYLGFAPLDSTVAAATTATIPVPFDEEVVIEYDMDYPKRKMAVTNDGSDETAFESPLTEGGLTEIEGKSERVASSTSAEVPPTPAEAPSTSVETTSVFEEMTQLLAASSEMRSRLKVITNRLWDTPEENRIGQDEVARLIRSFSDVIQTLNEGEPLPNETSNSRIEQTVTVLAVRKKFCQHLAVVIDRLHGADPNNDETFRQTLRNAVLDAHEATYEVDKAVAEIDTRVRHETGGMAGKDQDRWEETHMQLADPFDRVRSLKEYWSTADDGRSLVAAMLDADDCHRLNSELGPVRCDCLIGHVAETIKDAIPSRYALGRLSGQRWIVLIPDKLPNAATDEIELARETIAKTKFTTGNVEQTITLTCAIAEATPDERPEALMRRLEETLQEAKRYGRNRTFLHEGDYPAPVVPPQLDVESRVIELA